MEYLTKEDIVLINKKTVEKHGGNFVPPFNFLEESALDYLIEAVPAEMFDSPLYPTIPDKAGIYMYNVISNHIFQDGNKRTGLGAALIFLGLNNFQLKGSLEKVVINENKLIPRKGESSKEILFEFTMELAEGGINLKECQKWFKQNIIKLDIS